MFYGFKREAVDSTNGDLREMISKIEVRDVSSAFAMEQIKYTTEMPLDYIVLEKESAASN